MLSEDELMQKDTHVLIFSIFPFLLKACNQISSLAEVLLPEGFHTLDLCKWLADAFINVYLIIVVV